MIAKDQVDAIVDRIRPFLHADGGDIEVLAVHGNSADIRLTGTCAGRSGAFNTLSIDLEAALRAQLTELDTIQVVGASAHCPSIDDGVVVGRTARMRALFAFARVLAGSNSTVLITGESGTGKEVMASVIHRMSARSAKPFAAVSCALFSETLVESELFGHVRGAFTDAGAGRAGRFEAADGGTIFLDDIDDVPLPIQVKLLRVLQTHSVERLGSATPVGVDVRVIAGSKRDLQQMVLDGSFRDDLYYRLNILGMSLPPLRNRPEDIPLLMEHCLRRYYRRRGRDAPPVSAAAVDALVRYPWPGNVRELENACERIAQTCTCEVIRVSCLPAALLFTAATHDPMTPAREACDAPSLPADAEPADALSLDDRVLAFERGLLQRALAATGGNKTAAAKLLRIKRSTLGDRLARCGLADGHGGPKAR